MVMAGEALARVPDSELDYDEELVYRWRGELFTGIGYDDTSPSGLSEVSYRDGLQDGPARDWYPSGALKGESDFRENVLHGTVREYNEDGVLASEVSYEYGIMLARSERNESGEMIETFRIGADSPSHALLERYRRDKGWPRVG
jgi:MORN repeat variant